ncbi:hypothetical protein EHS25_003377 [Saitozyma podzolica]|uniref:Uncharacterized protein n=1 Tax=Saitozyma podzolica TaxID=1890683 RepID=A0A427Y922_9TREE|nr:hypothetical protein EHS25_003377 [Saitozyma podzolica]
MDEVYRAKLSGDPPTDPATAPANEPQPIYIQPHPNPARPGTPPRPVPIHLPNIYVNPYPPRAPTPPPTATAPRNVPAPAPPATNTPPPADPRMSIGPWKVGKPHPLLWISLLLSVMALVLEVPKGSLPTLTGRHKTLRTQERLVAEKLTLLTQLSTFLPPPLSRLVAPINPADPTSSAVLALGDRGHLELFRPGSLRFWNTYLGGTLGFAGDGERWWSVEELGQGASVVRSRGEGQEREVWVIQTPSDEEYKDSTLPLVNSLTHSLLLRDRLQAEIDKLRATPCPSCPHPSSSGLIRPGDHPHPLLHSAEDEEEAEMRRKLRAEEWERIEERKRREKEREREVEEREREVARREKWVVEEMRKLSEKVHSQATELTLEDRITERLKAYQRQLAHLSHDTDAAVP